MVEHQSPTLDLAFGALADRTRRAILFRISQRESTVSELAQPFDMSIAAVSKHLMVLERAKLVTKVKEGRNFRCRLNPEPFKEVSELLKYFEAFWTVKLDALETYFIDKKSQQGNPYAKTERTTVNPKASSKTRHSRHPKRGV